MIVVDDPYPLQVAPGALGIDHLWKRNKKVALKHGFEGARELILAWNG
jgi:hypothetical protein